VERMTEAGDPSTEAKRLEKGAGLSAHQLLVHFRLFEQLKRRNVIRVGLLYALERYPFRVEGATQSR